MLQLFLIVLSPLWRLLEMIMVEALRIRYEIIGENYSREWCLTVGGGLK